MVSAEVGVGGEEDVVEMREVSAEGAGGMVVVVGILGDYYLYL